MSTHTRSPRPVRVVLPTTGYIFLRSSHRDGRDPLPVTQFTGARNETDARAQFAADVDSLRRHAPSNVVHTISLVLRTDAGDTVLDSATEIRGAGAPLT